MKLSQTLLKKLFIVLMVAVQVLGYSATSFSSIALADDTAASTSGAVVPPACPTVNGTVAPTGAASATFVFDPATCLWGNAYYSWSPVTKEYTPKYSQTPVYNPDNNCWEHTVWEYVSSAGKYQSRLISVPAAPLGQAGANALPSQISGGSDKGALAQSTGSSTISAGNGTNSNNTLQNNNNTNVNASLLNNTSVLTALGSNATSGDASALFNTTVGNVGTGNAAAIASILNMIQSSWNPANGDFNLFRADLYSNYFGDLLFDPSVALGNGTGSNNNIATTDNNNLTVNATDNANIVNNVNLNAKSGNADASGNTTVGNVSTGNASAVADVINMINSLIVSGNSFIGSINLYGDLNGDILLPKSLLQTLLGNGTGSTNNISSNQNTDINANSTTNSGITNNTDLTATSGLATADANTTVGNIATGNADTKVNEMSLVGQNVQGTKGLLVFVNVLGTWVGMIFGVPGTSSITGGNGTNSTNNIANNSNTNADINATNNYGITNNLNLNAASGDAKANANTTVGDVSTGNASSSVNLLNMINSTVNFTDWFGVLFINVFGSWHGSFGVDTPFGNHAASTTAGGQGGGGNLKQTTPQVASANTPTRQTFSFLPHGGSGEGSGQVAAASTTASANPGETSSAHTDDGNQTVVTPSLTKSGHNYWLPAVFGVTAVLILFGERLLALIRRS